LLLNHYQHWDLGQWLHALEHRHAQEIQLGLGRIQEVAKRLNLLQPHFKVITVGGTNGKGSTVTALSNLYHSAGYKVGTYTSPHLIQFNERISLNLKSVTDDALCRAFCIIEEARESIHLTYFETATLAAFLIFKQQSVDIAILEVGLGGRLDATNIVDSDVAVITTIDFDHQELLGNTLDAIGFEKAGIMRHGKACIYADDTPPESIAKVANEKGVQLIRYGRDYTIDENSDSWQITLHDRIINHLPKPIIQLKSAAAAIVAVDLLQECLPVSDIAIANAMTAIFIPGRLQWIKGRVSKIYDVSHNPQGARLLAHTIQHLNVEGRVHAVFSALKDKDILGLILPLRDCIDRWYPAQLDNKRAPDAKLLIDTFAQADISVDFCYNNPLEAAKAAAEHATDGDLIVIYGSFYTVGQVMTAELPFNESKEIQ
jgi:dihydrofolate synthase / folylpolyglutamate synthase